MVLKIVVFCCFFSVSVEIFFHEAGFWIEIQYLDLFNLKGGIYTTISSGKVCWVIVSGLFKFVQKTRFFQIFT